MLLVVVVAVLETVKRAFKISKVVKHFEKSTLKQKAANISSCPT
jgi:hypothetical protein